MENNHIEVIGIDHGWANIKTISQVFTAAVKEITTEPALYDNVLEYDGTDLYKLYNTSIHEIAEEKHKKELEVAKTAKPEIEA